MTSSDRTIVRRLWIALCALMLGTIVVYSLITALSQLFGSGYPEVIRPIPLVLLLLGVAFFIQMKAIRIVLRMTDNRFLTAFIVLSSLLMRAILVPSEPIQEVDIYRYVWDGSVLRQGVNPYRYSPEQVILAANGSVESVPADLQRLVDLTTQSPGARGALEQVHFGFLPTVYPPVSQAVFAAAIYATPTSAPLIVHLRVMKCCFVLFDMATLLLVIRLIRRLNQHVGLSIIYGWCPLLMKEVANSGHLDAIAVFFTTLAVYLAVSADTNDTELFAGWRPTFSACMLALAVGAKLYPIVLAPLLFLHFARRFGDWWKPGLTFVLLLGILCVPMLPQHDTLEIVDHGEQSLDPSDGIVAFLRHWEMNDFLFLITIENIKPASSLQPHERAWFTLFPDRLDHARRQWCELISRQLSTERFPVEPHDVPFLTARAITLDIFAVLCVIFALRFGGGENLRLVQACFLTTAWFWLLCPTLNPWYWTWAMPLLIVMRNRAWWLMSGIVLIYYVRFWLQYHYPQQPVWGTVYRGTVFFDLVVTWIEFAPWFVFLAANWAFGQRRNGC